MEPFGVKDCALIALATGVRAQNLRELRDGIQKVPAASLYQHFWGRLLQPRFDEPEFNNDFAAWASHGLHDKSLAERLSVIDPSDFDDLEGLRQELVETIEIRLDESEFVPWARTDNQFHFILSQIVVFDTRRRLKKPNELARRVRNLSAGSIFYHFIDARRRPPHRVDDFSAWLMGWGDTYAELLPQLAAIDPYFASLKELRRILADLFALYFQEKAS